MRLVVAFIYCIANFAAFAQRPPQHIAPILPGAYQTYAYLPLLKGKRVAVFANQTTTIFQTHLIDSLQQLGINIVKIFAPEHGFRGVADAGEKVDSYIDKPTGIPVISLYGKRYKPTAVDLKDIDILLFDIQDVGVRFYTFISSLQGFIESAIQYDKPLIILDRPNPNGFYIDGPVLEMDYKSFVGMQPIPIVYGMTIGEYAKMLLGEKMLDWKYIHKEDHQTSLGELLGFEEEHHNFKLTVIPCKNYTHATKYVLPIRPSPNLPDMASVYWYPTTCLFEGTVLSEGRGTDHPFCIFGHPSLPDTLFTFTPTVRLGAKEPKQKDKLCHGWDVHDIDIVHQANKQLQLKYLLNAWQLFPEKDSFFIAPLSDSPFEFFFNKLAGNSLLMEQIKAGKTEAEIRQSWQPKLKAFKQIRKKYLLYKDFE
ncbi:exo-beta-N-acetylmuramidase NamZ domain-containing protein [Parasediminibacterium sp. JCM 36343]|uniref:exo-beta-N-acetylmuramidase NamZ family protein n=1 Tax=Parasediminibacterium sp. JCM 36343 TaxID=3374279 RepID=UPI00397B832D